MRSWSRFENVDTTIPVVKYHLDDKIYYAIIDSGSEQTVFDSDFVAEHNDLFKMRQENKIMSLSGVGANPTETVCRFASTVIGFRKPFSIEVEGILMSLRHLSEHFSARGIRITALIGSDVLSANNAHIDYNTHKLIFQ